MKNVIDRSNTPLTFNWVEDSEHPRNQSKRPSNPTVRYGPLTALLHERHQQNRDEPDEVPGSSKNSAAVKDKHEKTKTASPTVVDVILVIAAASLAFVVAIHFGLFAFILIESCIRSLRDTFHSLFINAAVDAANVETAAFLNNTSSSSAEVEHTSIPSAILKYTKMAIWPFVLFVPSFFLFSHLIIGMTSGNSQSRDRKKVTWKVLLSLVSLFAFMEAMLAMAYASRWTLLGITSAFPLLMMILARLSMASAGKYGIDMITPSCGNSTAAAATMDPDESMVCKCIAIACCDYFSFCTVSLTSLLFGISTYAAPTPSAAVASAIVLMTFFAAMAFSSTLVDRKLTNKRRRLSMAQRVFAALSISEAIILAKEWYTGRSILLFLSETLGFLFIFLPFTAGILHHLLELLYILSVPLSSLAICTIAGLSPISLIGLFLSILLVFIGTNMLYFTLLLSYRIYSWLIYRHLALLSFSAWLPIFTGFSKEEMDV